MSTLASKVDFSSQQMSDDYDSVLLKLYNENDKDFASLSKSLGALPIKAKRLALISGSTVRNFFLSNSRKLRFSNRNGL